MILPVVLLFYLLKFIIKYTFRNKSKKIYKTFKSSKHKLTWFIRRKELAYASSVLSNIVIIPFNLILCLSKQPCKPGPLHTSLLDRICGNPTVITPEDINIKLRKKHRHNQRSKVMKSLMLVASMPLILRGKELVLHKQLMAFQGIDCILDTQRVPTSLLKDLRAMIMNDETNQLYSKAKVETGLYYTGCSLIGTPNRSDFKRDALKPLQTETKMNGIAGQLSIAHMGITNYQTIDTKERMVKIERKRYLVPELPMRLLPPQKLMLSKYNEWFKINDKFAYLEFRSGQQVNTPMPTKSGLPYMFLFNDVIKELEHVNKALYSCVAKENNQNLSFLQKETL